MIANTFSNAKGGPTTTAEQNSDIEILTTFKDTIRDGPLRAVFESVIAILALMRDEAIEDDSLTELARLCFRICRICISATRGGDTDSFGGLSKEQVEEFGSTARCIKSMIRERANYSHNPRHRDTDPDEECVTAWRADLRRILDAFDGESECDNNLRGTEPKRNVGEYVIEAIKSKELVPALPMPNSTLDEKPDPGTDNTSSAPADSPGVLSPVLPSDANPATGSPHIPNFDKEPLRRLVSGTVPHDELPALIEKVVLNATPADIVQYLQKNDAQIFIDVIDQALDDFDFPLRTRNKCVRSLYKTCAGHTLFPRSMRLEFPGNAMGDICGRGGFGIVSKHEYCGRELAVKTLRPRGLSSQEMSNRFWKEVITWKAVRHPNVLLLLGVVATDNEFAMVSEWMPNGNIKQYIGIHQDANRFQLLADVAKGLVHIHSQGMIHRDLKGANILVDLNGRACLADFGLLTIVPVGTDVTPSNSFIAGGTLRWMGPELFYPEKFGLTERRMTKSSDCYALGMVVYEVLSGKLPFHHYKYRGGVAAIWKIVKGYRPERPQGGEGLWFIDVVWNVLECCWKPDPDDRPGVEDVLCCLEEASRSWTPIPMIPGPPSTDPLARDPNSCGAEDEPSSASQTTLSEPSRTLSFGGNFLPWPANEVLVHEPKPPSCPGPEEFLRQLVNGNVPQDTLRPLVEIVSNSRAVGIIQRLPRSDIQTFVDVVDQALDSIGFPPEIHNRCFRLLYDICARDSLSPGSLHLELPVGAMKKPRHRGGFADIFKRTYRDQEVAVKVLRVRARDDPKRIKRAFWREVMAWRYFRHPNVLPLLGVVVTENQFFMVSKWMPNGNIVEFVKAQADANRCELLVGVAKGLIYLHHREMVHGDLKGANILVDDCGQPRLADFGSLRIAFDHERVESPIASSIQGGTIRWMSPELLDPERYGFKDVLPTKHSDCYALGMVVYEVLSGKTPFHSYNDFDVMARVLGGERPERLERVERIWFLDDIRNILERCWNSNPGDRPSIEDVLQCLEEASRRIWIPPRFTFSLMTGSGDEEIGDLIAIPPIIHPFHHSSAPSRVPGFQPLGIDTNNPSLSEESERNLGRVSSRDSLSRDTLGQQRTHSSRKRRSSIV